VEAGGCGRGLEAKWKLSIFRIFGKICRSSGGVPASTPTHSTIHPHALNHTLPRNLASPNHHPMFSFVTEFRQVTNFGPDPSADLTTLVGHPFYRKTKRPDKQAEFRTKLSCALPILLRVEVRCTRVAQKIGACFFFVSRDDKIYAGFSSQIGAPPPLSTNHPSTTTHTPPPPPPPIIMKPYKETTYPLNHFQNFLVIV